MGIVSDELLDFERLEAYQLALNIVDIMYALAAGFPPQERYGLAAQMRRAAVSILANIAEAVGRDTLEDRRRIYFIARGSLYESIALNEIARRRGYVPPERCASIRSDLRRLARMLSGLINACRHR